MRQRIHQIRRAAWVGSILLLAAAGGCLPTYVGDPAQSVVDERLLGVWNAQGANPQLWFVHRLDAHSYLIQLYNLDRRDGSVAVKGQPHTMQGWLTPIGGKTFLSMRLFDPRQLTDPASGPNINRYVVARLDWKGDTLTAAAVAPDFVKAQSLRTPAALEAALAAHVDDKSVYLDPTTYDHVDVKKPGDLGDLLKAVTAAADAG